MSPARESVFVGIDVAKDWLDIAVRPTGAAWRVAQDEEGIADLVRQLTQLQPKLIVMEASGGYERLSAIALDAARLPVAVVNARHVREFAKSQGKLGKTDRLDAASAAHFGEVSNIKLRPLPTAEARELEALVTRRRPAHPDADRRTAAPPAGAALSPAQHRPQPSPSSIRNWPTSTRTSSGGCGHRRSGGNARTCCAPSPASAPPSPSPCWRNCPNSARSPTRRSPPSWGWRPSRATAAGSGERASAGAAGRACGRPSTCRRSPPCAPTRSSRSSMPAWWRAGKPGKVALTACMHKLLTILNAMLRHVPRGTRRWLDIQHSC